MLTQYRFYNTKESGWTKKINKGKFRKNRGKKKDKGKPWHTWLSIFELLLNKFLWSFYTKEVALAALHLKDIQHD